MNGYQVYLVPHQAWEVEKLEVTEFLFDRITKSKCFAKDDLQSLRQRLQLAYSSR